MADTKDESLTAQQRRCLDLVGEGLTTKEIAFQLGLSQRTIDEHIEKAVAKLRAPNRHRAAAILRRQADDAHSSTGQKHPYLIRVGINPVDQPYTIDASLSSTSRLEDGGKSLFEAFPEVEALETTASGGVEKDGSANHLTIMRQVLIIAVSLIVILIAMPSLVHGAEAIASFFLKSVQSR